jgi:hypothetical protein
LSSIASPGDTDHAASSGVELCTIRSNGASRFLRTEAGAPLGRDTSVQVGPLMPGSYLVVVPALEKTFKNPEIVERFAKIGCIVQYMGPKEFTSYIETRIPLMRKIAQDANLIQK